MVMISYDCLELSAFFRSKVDDARAGLKHYAKNVVGKKCNTPFRHRKGGGWVRFQPFFEHSKGKTACYLSQDARAGIRTRVGGMKTHYDGPSYTTRATAKPPTTP